MCVGAALSSDDPLVFEFVADFGKDVGVNTLVVGTGVRDLLLKSSGASDLLCAENPGYAGARDFVSWGPLGMTYGSIIYI